MKNTKPTFAKATAGKKGAKFTKEKPEFHPDSYRDFVIFV
jgi:hypothetical protein